MGIQGNVLIMDTNTARRHQLETLLSFLNVDWVSETCSDVLTQWPENQHISGVVLGQLPHTSIDSILMQYPKIPFVTTDELKKSYPNHIGELKAPSCLR